MKDLYENRVRCRSGWEDDSIRTVELKFPRVESCRVRLRRLDVGWVLMVCFVFWVGW